MKRSLWPPVENGLKQVEWETRTDTVVQVPGDSSLGGSCSESGETCIHWRHIVGIGQSPNGTPQSPLPLWASDGCFNPSRSPPGPGREGLTLTWPPAGRVLCSHPRRYRRLSLWRPMMVGHSDLSSRVHRTPCDTARSPGSRSLIPWPLFLSSGHEAARTRWGPEIHM